MRFGRRCSQSGALQSDLLKQRLEAVEERIEIACQRSGRKRSEVTLVAATKVFPASTILEAYELGLRDFGENYVQEFAGKRPALGAMADARFHLIGHLQSNKTNVAGDLFDVIQTIDTPKLARRLNALNKPIEVMIEAKLSEEQSKAGADPSDIPELIAALGECPNLQLTGLMTMPPWTDDAEPSRPYFAKLRALAEEFGLKNLSMGMSHDFEVAIEEGATHIRVGTALFGKRRKQ